MTDIHLASAHLRSGTTAYAEHVRAGKHELLCDEPEAHGGGDLGPPPYALLAASLGACTAITLRMYAARKGWPIEPLEIDVRVFRTEDTERIERAIRVAPELTLDQKKRLLEIADKTPVTKTLGRGTEIKTTLK
ncbi:MAG: OsmC family protein [Acidobacteriota bacterium]